MGLSEEKMKILKMLEEGKINSEDAAKLIEALEKSESTERGGQEETETAKSLETGTSLKIKVTNMDTGKVKVNLTIPMKLAHFAKTLVPSSEKFKLEQHGINLDELFSTLGTGKIGKILEVEDEIDRQRIEIWIE